MKSDDKENVDRHLYAVYTNDVSKKKEEPRTVNITIKATQSLKDALDKIASGNERSVSQTALLLIQRGLAAYNADGKLINVQPSEQSRVPIFEINDKVSMQRIVEETGYNILIVSKVFAGEIKDIEPHIVKAIRDAAQKKTEDNVTSIDTKFANGG